MRKKKYSSQVGEIYSAKTLTDIAADFGYSRSLVLTQTDFESYALSVLQTVNAGEIPILFYDIDMQGEPTDVQSNREHAVAVAGYFMNQQDKLGFIICQGGTFFWALAEDIFASASQLSSRRIPELFYKYKTWNDSYTIKNYHLEWLLSPPRKQRQARPLPKNDGGLKNKILIINKPDVLNRHSFWSSSFSPALTTMEMEILFTRDLIKQEIIYETARTPSRGASEVGSMPCSESPHYVRNDVRVVTKFF